jgi:hypothetical protein
MALTLAGGGECCLDIEQLRIGDDLFGSVPSNTTVIRAFHEITPETRAAIAGAIAEVRSAVWRRSSATTGSSPVILDIDASLVEIHSENKEQAEPTFKGGYGFHPMFCFSDATGETLGALLRPSLGEGFHRYSSCTKTPYLNQPNRCLAIPNLHPATGKDHRSSGSLSRNQTKEKLQSREQPRHPQLHHRPVQPLLRNLPRDKPHLPLQQHQHRLCKQRLFRPRDGGRRTGRSRCFDSRD